MKRTNEGRTLRIDVELDESEDEVLLLALGIAMGWFTDHTPPEMAKILVGVTNKLMASHPDFTPYDPNSYDPANKRFFPFKKVTTQ